MQCLQSWNQILYSIIKVCCPEIAQTWPAIAATVCEASGEPKVIGTTIEPVTFVNWQIDFGHEKAFSLTHSHRTRPRPPASRSLSPGQSAKFARGYRRKLGGGREGGRLCKNNVPIAFRKVSISEDKGGRAGGEGLHPWALSGEGRTMLLNGQCDGMGSDDGEGGWQLILGSDGRNSAQEKKNCKMTRQFKSKFAISASQRSGTLRRRSRGGP